MTTATPRRGGGSARPGIRRGAPFEDGEDGLELGAQVFDRLGRERTPCLRLELTRATILLDLLASALDGVLFRVEQVLDQHDQLDLAPLVHAVAGAVLGGVQKAELAFPVAQHVRLQIGELAHLADRKEFLDGLRRAHPPPTAPASSPAPSGRPRPSRATCRGTARPPPRARSGAPLRDAPRASPPSAPCSRPRRRWPARPAPPPAASRYRARRPADCCATGGPWR